MFHPYANGGIVTKIPYHLFLQTMKLHLLAMLLILAPTLLLGQVDSLSLGQMAPDFMLPYATKDSISRTPLRLSDFHGRRTIILAFYPADWSSGCTKEMCSFRDDFSSLAGLNAEVIAISGDYVWSHHEWAKHLSLPIILASDHSHAVAKKYMSFNEATQLNRRTIFVVDSDGRLVYQDLEYRVSDSGDFDRLKSFLRGLR